MSSKNLLGFIFIKTEKTLSQPLELAFFFYMEIDFAVLSGVVIFL
jgi:hypothetical protein